MPDALSLPPAARFGATVRDRRSGTVGQVRDFQRSTNLVFVTWTDRRRKGCAWKPLECLEVIPDA